MSDASDETVVGRPATTEELRAMLVRRMEELGYRDPEDAAQRVMRVCGVDW